MSATVAPQTIDHLRRVIKVAPPTVGQFLTVQYAGSTAHGTYVPKSNPLSVDDVDIMAVWLPTRRAVYGLLTAEHWMQWDEELDIVTYELRKFAKLLMKGNPNVLGMLWSPHVQIYRHPLWQRWIDARGLFITQRCYDSFSGYAYAQLMRLGKPNVRGYMGKERKALFAEHGYDIKNAAHCIRLLRMGVELFETGQLNVDRTNIDADELKEIKSGKWTLGQVQRAAEEGFDKLHPFKDSNRFPRHCDEAAVEELVIQTITEAGL